MKEYNQQLHNSYIQLEEICDSLKDIVRFNMEENIVLLNKGWQCDNGKKASNICNEGKKEMMYIIKDINNTIDILKNKM